MPESHTYRPSRWIRLVVGLTLLVFVAIAVVAFRTDLHPFYRAVAVGMVGFAALAFAETFVARVDVERGTIVTKSLFATRRIALTDVQKVSAEGGRTSLYMKTGKWKKLPEWMGSDMSARRRIADQLKR
jgi:hypothetical protein